MTQEQKPPQTEKPKTQPMGFWIAIGVAIGAGIGVAMDNIGVGVAIVGLRWARPSARHRIRKINEIRRDAGEDVL